MYQFGGDNHLKSNYVVKWWQYLSFQKKGGNIRPYAIEKLSFLLKGEIY